jgi:hypothetical protein
LEIIDISKIIKINRIILANTRSGRGIR